MTRRSHDLGRVQTTRRRAPLRAAGFTFVELVTALVMAGIVAFAVPRFFDDNTFLAQGYYEELATALKYARKLAVVSGCAVRVEVAADGYVARRQAGPGSCAAEASGRRATGGLAGGRLFSGRSPIGVSTSPAVTWIFDALGHTDLAADTSISVGSFALTVRSADGTVEAP